MNTLKSVSLLVAIMATAACTSLGEPEAYLLGDANRANIAAQSSRDVTLPNEKQVESTSGVRAVNAVKALNEGQTKQLASAGTGGAE